MLLREELAHEAKHRAEAIEHEEGEEEIFRGGFHKVNAGAINAPAQ
jgi:hypothetical protein